MDLFDPKDIEGEHAVRAYSNEAWGFLRNIQAMNLHGSIRHHIRTIELALATVVRGNRGVGAVILHQGSNIVGEGNNTVQDEDNVLMHLGHAELNAITAMNIRFGRQTKQLIPETELVSSIGPCAMCMGGVITRKIPQVTTLSPDYTGGISLEGMAKAFPGWKTRIDEEDIKYRVADLTEYPDNLGKKIARLAWALSRITLCKLNREEFEKGVEGHQALGNGE